MSRQRKFQEKTENDQPPSYEETIKRPPAYQTAPEGPQTVVRVVQVHFKSFIFVETSLINNYLSLGRCSGARTSTRKNPVSQLSEQHNHGHLEHPGANGLNLVSGALLHLPLALLLPPLHGRQSPERQAHLSSVQSGGRKIPGGLLELRVGWHLSVKYLNTLCHIVAK